MKSWIDGCAKPPCPPCWKAGQIVRRKHGCGTDVVVLVTCSNGLDDNVFTGVSLYGKSNTGDSPGCYSAGWRHEHFALYDGTVCMKNG